MSRLQSLIFFAGLPPTIVQGSTSLVTTLPATTIALHLLSLPALSLHWKRKKHCLQY